MTVFLYETIVRRNPVNISPNNRKLVYHALPGNRRSIVQQTGLPSYAVPALLRWLKRRGLAFNERKGHWEPKPIPGGTEVCWKHGILIVDNFCPACPAEDRRRERAMLSAGT
jgi:hypothetical protein